MTEVNYIVHDHYASTEEVTVYHGNRPGSGEETRYRWACSCGKAGKGTHATKAKALSVALDHTKPEHLRSGQKQKALSNGEKFRRGVTLLADRGFTYDEIMQVLWDLNAALRQGTGLDGTSMRNIIDEALEPHTLHAEARALFESDPSSKHEANWHNLADYKRDGWYQTALVVRLRNATAEAEAQAGNT